MPLQRDIHADSKLSVGPLNVCSSIQRSVQRRHSHHFRIFSQTSSQDIPTLELVSITSKPRDPFTAMASVVMTTSTRKTIQLLRLLTLASTMTWMLASTRQPKSTGLPFINPQLTSMLTDQLLPVLILHTVSATMATTRWIRMSHHFPTRISSTLKMASQTLPWTRLLSLMSSVSMTLVYNSSMSLGRLGMHPGVPSSRANSG